MTTRTRFGAIIAPYVRQPYPVSGSPIPAETDPVALERELAGLLLEYEILRAAWPKARHVQDRAKIGR